MPVKGVTIRITQLLPTGKSNSSINQQLILLMKLHAWLQKKSNEKFLFTVFLT